MTNAEIFRQAEQAANDAVAAQYGHRHPSCDTPAGDYFKLVFESVAAHLQRHINGVY